MSGALEFRVLGPFGVLRDGLSVGPAGSKRRGLLAALVLRANQTVSTTELIDALWADEPPPSATNVVQTYVSAWRRALEPDRTGRVSAGRLVTEGSGYRLRVEPTELDMELLTQAVADAKASVATGDHRAAAARLGDALSLWCGPPLADLTDLPFHAPAAEMLNELHLHVLEEWATAALRNGTASDAIPVMRDAREQNPLRERLSELLMWALLQDGQQGAALATYDEVRRRLAEELGTDPSAGLREMHARVLRHDPDLGPPTPLAFEARLPLLTDSFVGRDHDIAEIRRLIAEHRLVTLTGAGGVGKTRLATEVARALAAVRATRKIVFVDASPLTDAALIPDRLARALGVRPAPGQVITDALAHAIDGHELLVILDNLEQLPDVASTVTELLRLGPGVCVLATSRTVLHARGEHVYPVATLAVACPEPDLATVPAAVALFVDRAAAADPTFELIPDTAAAVAEICKRLDGLPLAVEIAASRVRVLPPQSLMSHLHRRLDLLVGASGDRPYRHQTLRATIDWSYQLLDPPIQRAFRALAVFRGGWSIAAAVAVCGRVDELSMLTELETLVDANLIEPITPHTAEQRFRMLETLREFGQEQLIASGDDGTRRSRHAEYVHALAANAAPHLTGPEQTSYLDALETERDNINNALEWLLDTGQFDRATRIAVSLWRFWHLRAHLAEGRSILETLLAAPTRLDEILRAEALNALGGMTYWQRDYAFAQHCYEQALAIYEKCNDRDGIALSHYNLGFTAAYANRSEPAGRHFGQAHSQYEQLADRLGASNARAGLALVDRMNGDYERARQRAAQSLAEQRVLADELGATNTLGLLGSITARTGNLDDADTMLREAIVSHDRVGNISGIVWMLHELAATAAARGAAERAVVLTGAAQSMDSTLGGGIGLALLGLAPFIDAARHDLGPARSQRAWDNGQRLTHEQAIATALAS